MNKKTEQSNCQIDLLSKGERIKKYNGLKFSDKITITKIDDNTFEIILQSESALSNMQDYPAAFEAWAICIKSENRDATFLIGVEGIANLKASPQFNQLLYRMHKFAENYPWVDLENDVKEKYTEVFDNCGTLVVNYPKGEAKETAENTEAQLEREYIKNHKSEQGVIAMNAQLPLDLFQGTIEESNRFFPKSHLDIWAIKNNEISIYELKAKHNNYIGIISELMYYCNVIRDIQKGKFIYEDEASLSTYRDFNKFYEGMKNKPVKGIFLTDGLHSFIKVHLNDILNILRSGKADIDYGYIHYTDTISKDNSYKEQQRTHQVNLLDEGRLFENKKGGGCFRDQSRNFCLEKDQEKMNLFSTIRDDKVTKYFNDNKITFWSSGKTIPNHLLSSQIACINHLFPIREDYKAVLSIAQQIDPEFNDVVWLENDVEGTRGYISFEVVSAKDHLNEGVLTRGSNCTSIDAVIMAKKNGENCLLVIEWKYTESYSNEDKSKGKRGEKRLNSYSDLIKNSVYLNKEQTSYKGSVYFHEPFYQLMRQTLWAEQMVNLASEEILKADSFIHVHVVPEGNKKLLDKDIVDKWNECLTDKGKENYILISPKSLLKGIKNTELKDYLEERYWYNQNS